MITHAPNERTSRSDSRCAPGLAAWRVFSSAIPAAVFAFATFLASSAFAQAVGHSKGAASPDRFQARAGEHTARTSDSTSARAGHFTYPQAWSVARSEGALPPAVVPPTRSSFLANWNIIGGATGYRLDVSTSRSFDSYLSGYRDLDVGDVTSRIVSGLSPGTTYYYRVRAYDSGGNGNASDIMTIATTSSSGLVIAPTFDVSILNNPNSGAIQSMINPGHRDISVTL